MKHLNEIRKYVRKLILEVTQEQKPSLWYHGSKNEFDVFKTKKGTLFDYNYTSPIFLTSDYDFAKLYAGQKAPAVYVVKILAKNIMEFRSLPNAYNLFMYSEKGIKDESFSEKEYSDGNKLMQTIEEKFPSENQDRVYNNIISGDYSSIEQIWVYDWLKKNKYDGAYVLEAGVLNVFVFSLKNISIIKKTQPLNEENNNPHLKKVLPKYKLRYPKTNMFVIVNIDKLLRKHKEDNPSYAFDNRETSNYPSRIDKAKKYWTDYAEDSRQIELKTGKRNDFWEPLSFEAPYVQIFNNKLGFSDGRHRVIAMKELGYTDIIIEIPKNQESLFAELT